MMCIATQDQFNGRTVDGMEKSATNSIISNNAEKKTKGQE